MSNPQFRCSIELAGAKGLTVPAVTARVAVKSTKEAHPEREPKGPLGVHVKSQLASTIDVCHHILPAGTVHGGQMSEWSRP